MDREQIWIKAIQKGQTDCFANLYDRYHRKLFSLCYRFTRDLADAEEQLQEIFMRMLDKIGQFNGQAAFSTWLHRLAVNHLINFQRHRNRRLDDVALEEQAVEKPARKNDPNLALTLEKALRELPAGYRHVFILHDQEGFRHDEIGEMLGCSAATSRSQLCRARMALRETIRSRPAKEAC